MARGRRTRAHRAQRSPCRYNVPTGGSQRAEGHGFPAWAGIPYGPPSAAKRAPAAVTSSTPTRAATCRWRTSTSATGAAPAARHASHGGLRSPVRHYRTHRQQNGRAIGHAALRALPVLGRQSAVHGKNLSVLPSPRRSSGDLRPNTTWSTCRSRGGLGAEIPMVSGGSSLMPESVPSPSRTLPPIAARPPTDAQIAAAAGADGRGPSRT